MRLLRKLGVGIAGVGLFLILVGGMRVRSGPDGTWVQVNILHVAGGVAVVLGTAISAATAFASGSTKTGEKDTSS
ncbi:MAG: hypothetical protein C0467_28145 [Planctomycetaceae bacterium]|nr:hypothetical protein [Planctomycetaceae bacterium]